MEGWSNNFTWASSNTSATWVQAGGGGSGAVVVIPAPPPTLREKTALERLDARINEVRALVVL